MSTARRVLITGAASGLGKAMALRCARSGWRVAICDLDRHGLAQTSAAIEELGGESLAVHVDVTRGEELRALAGRIREAWGGLDALINNAGIASAGRTDEVRITEFRRVFDVNFFAVVECTQIMLAQMAPGGHIVNIASFAGIAAAPGMAAYNTVKAAVISFSETLRAELQDQNIRVSVACPSFFQTGLLREMTAPRPESKELAAKMMKRSRVTADDVAAQIFDALGTRRFMLIAHAEARWGWRFKRWFPETWFRLLHRVSRRSGVTRPVVELSQGESR